MIVVAVVSLSADVGESYVISRANFLALKNIKI